MILPSKNLDLDRSPLYVGARILKQLQQNAMSLDLIFSDLEAELGAYSYLIAMRAINILYLSGRVRYNNTNDSLEITNEN